MMMFLLESQQVVLRTTNGCVSQHAGRLLDPPDTSERKALAHNLCYT